MSGEWKSGFVPWSESETRPVLLLKPPRQIEYIDADDYYERNIEALRTAWALDCFPPAQLLNEAVALCRDHNRPQPDWLADALSERLRFSVDGDASKRGRQSRDSGLERDRRAHFVRWAYASTALARRDDLPRFGYASTREGAWRFVSDQLIGTPESGTADTVERSYKQARRMIARNGRRSAG